MELIKKANGNLPRTNEEKEQMIKNAAEYYGGFLEALGFDWKADPHSDRTPHRIVDFYSRRPNIQESLTKQIHDHVHELCVGNRGVAVVVESQHNCVKCRGIKQDSVMKTSQMSGYFWTNEIGTRQEFFQLIDQSRT